MQSSELAATAPEASSAAGGLSSIAAELARNVGETDRYGLYGHAGPGPAGRRFLGSGLEATKRKTGVGRIEGHFWRIVDLSSAFSSAILVIFSVFSSFLPD